MKDVDKIALAAFLHDIGKFAQRAEFKLRGDFNKNIYGYKHANYTAQVLQDYFNDIEGYHQYAYEHHIVNENSDINSWIVAAADRLASGFERERFNKYNELEEKENFKEQRLFGLFDENERYKIAKLDVENIFYAKEKAKENEYISLWDDFKKDLKKLRDTDGNQITDLISLDYLLKKYTTFIPSAIAFKKDSNTPIKPNVPLYDHLKATAIFAAAISGLDNDKKENIINYYRLGKYEEKKEFILINGDFFGIQSFIFNDIEAKSASKVLRGKSAFVQILTKVIAFYIIEKLELSFFSIISEGAGKFEILAPNNSEIKEKLKNIQQELNEYFVREFFGETGVGVSFVECGLYDFIIKEDYKKLRKRLSKKVELTKLNKFDLLNNEYEINWDKNLNNQNQCFACKKRAGIERKDIEKKVCDSCYRFIKIGKNLTKMKYLVFTKDKTDIEIFKGIYIKFLEKDKNPKGLKNTVAIYDISKESNFSGFAKWEISSYVAVDEEKILTFEELAQKNCEEDRGIKALMSLKADVDNMGQFIQNSDVTDSFAKYNFFSRMIDYYFGVYVPYLLKGSNTYTIFAGGDDLFILGAWNEMIKLSKKIREDFLDFVKGSPLTLSVGMILTKPNKPVNFIAKVSEEALEKSKDMDGKDAITLFDETVKWEDYLDDNGLLEELEILNDNTTILYRLLELVELGKKVKDDPKATIWKSKLSYLFVKNMDTNKKEIQDLLKNLNLMIEKFPEETKMYLSEFIYKRRRNV
ncbi:type III-A CRISPR-associated protein Cas10/Csm1 [Caminibacter profundus]